jgi:hypothetical protein
MATTAVIPAFSLTGTAVGGLPLPQYSLAGTDLVGAADLPAYTLANARITSGVLPAYGVSVLVFSLNMTGGIILGSGARIKGDPDIVPTGGSLASGAATVSAILLAKHEIYPLGGAQITGSPYVYHYQVLGANVGGSATVGVVNVLHDISSGIGGASLSGAALIQELIPYKANGGVFFGGTFDAQTLYSLPAGGGVLVAGAANVQAYTTFLPVGGCALAGAASVATKSPVHIPKSGALLSGAAIAFAVPKGGIVTAENPYNASFDGWALNYETYAPSRYERLAANSICRFNGVTYVSNAGGIYAIDADDDAGQEIQASVSFGNSDFSDKSAKRVSAVYLGLRSTYKMKLNITTNGRTAYYFDVEPPKSSEHGSRLTPGKGLNGLFLSFRLDNQRGAYFELDALTLELAVSNRMGL